MKGEEPTGQSADATWKQHREAIAERNAAVKKRAAAERKSRAGITGARLRAEDALESEQLAELNEQIVKRRRRSGK